MIYLSFSAGAVESTSKVKNGVSSTAPSSSSSFASTSSSIPGSKIPTRSNVEEDQVDVILQKMDGTVKRKRDPKKYISLFHRKFIVYFYYVFQNKDSMWCTCIVFDTCINYDCTQIMQQYFMKCNFFLYCSCLHGDNSSCIHCLPLEPYDAAYLKDLNVKHMSFHAYLRKLSSGLDGGKYANLENISCRIKPGCTGHPPWPKGVCSKCQPKAITLNSQVKNLL